MSRDDLEGGYVLHGRPYRESSLLLEVFTAHHGRLGMIARGARRSKRSRSGILQPFQPLLMNWKGRGELPVLARVERVPQPFAAIPSERLALGFYLNELLIRLLPRGDPHERLFEAYARVLEDLIGLPDAEPSLRRFELRLLDELGYAMELQVEADSGAPVDPSTVYCYEIERGAVPVAAPRQSDFCVRGQTLLSLDQGRFADDSERREARRLMSAVIRHYLGGVEPRSREMLKRSW